MITHFRIEISVIAHIILYIIANMLTLPNIAQKTTSVARVTRCLQMNESGDTVQALSSSTVRLLNALIILHILIVRAQILLIQIRVSSKL